MMLPSGYEKMSDEELIDAIEKIYNNRDTAIYLIDYIRGRIPSEDLWD